MSINWEFYKNDIIRLYSEGKNVAEISRIIGSISQTSIWKYLQTQGIEIRKCIPSKKYLLNENFFKEISNEKSAYWLGFLMADGYIEHKSKNQLSYCISVGLNPIDYKQVEKFRNDVSSNHPIKILDKNNNKYQIAIIDIYNKTMCLDLMRHGCVQKKSLIVTFPFHIDKKWYRDIIRGYFDGDGCICHKSNGVWEITICSGSMEFLYNCNSIFKIAEPSIDCSITEGHGVRVLRIKSKSYENFYHYLYDGATTYLDRKRDKFIEMGEDKQWSNL